MSSAVRDISPVGTSRFEMSSDAPDDEPAVKSASNSAAVSPTSPSFPATRFSNFSKPSRHTMADSVFSQRTTETEATSAPSMASSEDPRESKDDQVHVVSPDDWLARFHSDDDLGGLISDDCPDRTALAAVQDIPIYDAEGKAIPFGSIHNPATASHQRQLVIFVRHFYCGACQAYLQALTHSITMRDYFSIPIPTSIIVIGCGKPDLIPHYRTFTNCPFPMYAEPTRELFKRLGMPSTLNIGMHRPEYMDDISATSWALGQFKTMNVSLKDPDGIRKRDLIRGGNYLQIGGEFLFDAGQVIWCHRMKHFRNHAEIKVLRRLLDLDE